MGYVGTAPLSGDYRKLDDISSSFDGSETEFTLQVGSANVTPPKETTMLISVGGILQEPVSAYTVSGSTLTFTSAPASGADFFGILLGDTMAIGTPSDGTISAAKVENTFISGQTEITSGLDAADELLYSDGGTIKKVGLDTLADKLAGTNITASAGVLSGTADTNTTYTGGTNLTLAGTTFNVDDAFLVNNASDATSGTITMAHLIVGDGGNIGSASDTDAIAISSGGVVTFSQSVTLANDATITLQDEGQIIFADDDPSTDDTGVGIVMKFTALTGLVVGELVHINANGKIDQSHPGAGVSTRVPAIGIALEANSSGSDAEVKVLLLGVYKDTSQFNFTPGEEVYAGHSGEGEFSQTAPSSDGQYVQRVGVALTADSIYFNPSLDVIEHA